MNRSKGNMKKFITLIAAAGLAAFATLAGDIATIEVVPNVDAGYTYPNSDSPHDVGDEIYILVRLLNPSWKYSKAHTESQYPWQIVQSATGTIIGDAAATVYWPKLKFAIGADIVEAEYVDEGPNGEGSTPSDVFYYTDLYFKYTVKEGELGLPIRFVNSKGEIIDSETGLGSDGFQFVNLNTGTQTTGYWNLQATDYDGVTQIAEAKYCEDYIEGASYPSTPSAAMHHVVSYIYPRAYVQTIDFESSYADTTDPKNKIWREVYQGLSDAVGKVPAISGLGPKTVYVWSEDESVVAPEGETELVGTTNVLKIVLNSDGEDVSFKLKGGSAAAGTTTTIYLSPYKKPPTNASGDIIEGSVLKRTVKLVAAPPPFMTVTDADDNQSTDLAATNPVKYVQMKLKLSAAFTSDFKVKVAPVPNKGTIDPIAEKYIAVLSSEDSDPANATSVTNIDVTAGATEVYFYVYGLGRTKDFSSVTFTPEIDKIAYPDAYAYYEGGTHKKGTINLKSDMAPQIDAALPPNGYKGTSVDASVTLLADNWRDTSSYNTNGYNVTITLGGTTLTTNGVMFAEGEQKTFPVTIPINWSTSTMTGKVTVSDPTGNKATKEISIEVNETLKAWPATFSTSVKTAEPDSDLYYCEGQDLWVRGVLSEASSVSGLYAYIVPMDEASSNLVETTATTNGLEITMGDVYSDAARITLKDGNVAGRKARFGLVIKNGPNWDDASVDGTYNTAVKYWTITITNAAPTVTKVWKGESDGGSLAYDDKNQHGTVPTYAGKLPSQNAVRFTAQIADKGILDLLDKGSPVRARWIWTDGDGEPMTPETVTVDTNGYCTCDITFYQDNSVQTISLYAQDRDMKAADKDDFGSLLASFKVKIGEVPSIIITKSAKYNSADGFYESSAKSDNYILVSLSEFPSAIDHWGRTDGIGTANPLEVKLTLDDSFKSDNGCLLFDGTTPTNEVTVQFTSANKAKAGVKVYFNPETITGGEDMPTVFRVAAEVTTVLSNKIGQTWKDYYAPGALEGEELFVWNVEPTIQMLAGDEHSFNSTGTNIWSAGEQITLKWKVSDIKKDITNGYFNISWSQKDKSNKSGYTLKELGNSVTYSGNSVQKYFAEGTYTFTVPNTENTEIVITANDGDGGTCEAHVFIYVEPTKDISINVFGPAGTSRTKYGNAAGVGRGHIYVEDSTGQYLSQEFSQTWSYPVSAMNANLRAAGYPASATNAWDNGTMGVALGYSTAAKLNQYGNKVTSSSGLGYPYGESDYDNYFYCWALLGGDDGIEYQTPQFTKSTTASAQFTPALGEKGENEGESYTIVQVEAIFSQEKYPSDNLGDLNGDGIPDVYLDFYRDLGVIGEDGAISGNDLKKLNLFNEGDGENGEATDYLPNLGTSYYSAFIPGLASSWVMAGREFTAETEIRGNDYHFNDAYSQIELKNAKAEIVYADPETCTTSTLSKVEWMAFVYFCTNRVTALDENDPENWTKWSPENPTDPTLEDTDGDGAPDGYEYYIWYGAHVGWLEENAETGTMELKKFYGRKYNPADPMNPKKIAPETIESIYNPTVANNGLTEADTDGDGLSDLLEFELGTSPFDYDTDGDGLPDGYEVMILGTDDEADVADGERAYVCDPLKWSTLDDDIGDGQHNPDGDSMVELIAECTALMVSSDLPGVTNYIITAGNAPLTVNGKFAMKILDEAGNELVAADSLSVDSSTKWENGEKVYSYSLAADALVWSNAVIDVESGVVDVSAAEQITLPAGTKLNEKSPTGENAPSYVGMWNYDNGEAGIEGQVVGSRIVFPTSFIGREAKSVATSQRLLHFDAYLNAPFDPRVAWNHTENDASIGSEPNDDGLIDRPFTTLDEFLMLTYWYRGGFISLTDITPSVEDGLSQIDIWQKYCTNPLNADSDLDGIPDGWELYTMVDPEALFPWVFGPTSDNSPLVNLGGFLELYDGSECSTCYPDCETIEWIDTMWTNKHWPCDPWANDTDGDGIEDLAERDYFIEYGGLNPHSMDTDGDGLPDQWEAEFAGTCTLESSGSSSATTTNETETNETATASSGTPVWNDDGMNGCVADDLLDYDQDGLLNWQEYMVGAMRCWRYDDTVSPWTSHKINWSASDEDRIQNQMSPDYNPHFANGFFDPTAQYFSWCVKPWDTAYGNMFMFRDGCTYLSGVRKTYKHNMAKSGYEYNMGADNKWSLRIKEGDMNCYYVLHDEKKKAFEPQRYICCDPRKRDTDGDSMDDYYELYHGMNPLLGKVGGYVTGATQPMLDIVYMAYACDAEGQLIKKQVNAPDAERNAWVGGHAQENGSPDLISTPKQKTADGWWDFHAYPWLNGLPEADIDGDGIRNQREAIMPKVQAASTYLHTDPSPLWMTDTSYEKSLVRRFYRGCAPSGTNPDIIADGPYLYGFEPFEFEDGSSILDYAGFYYDPMDGLLFDYHVPWQKSGAVTQCNRWNTEDYLFDFEEDEGFDTDHDYLGDYEEQQGKTKSSSDALNTEDPLRRQAMYFDGVKSFLETPLEDPETLPFVECGCEMRENFLYFTAECWAKPDLESCAADKQVTILERTIATGISSNADEDYLKRNFLIGIRNGRWYAKFDPPTTFSGDAVEITDGPRATNGWTHVAVTYGPANGDETDASAKMVFKLYVNGVCNNYKNTGASPEHGVAAITTGSYADELGLIGELSGRRDYSLVAILVGASARSEIALVLDGDYRYGPSMGPTFASYNNYYKGYVDEIRIWDGARSASDILADYKNKTRYTLAMALENRQDVYEAWAQGALRTAASASGVKMPAQLMYHFAFDHLPGAINSDIVLQSPAGFTLDDEYTTDHKAMWLRPDGYVNNWWDSVEVKSLVYTDRAWIPWVINTVAHLPMFDDSTRDSFFWSLNMAGSHYATEFGYTDFDFPNTMEPSCNRRQMTHPKAPFSNPSRWYIVNTNDIEKIRYRFAHRNACNSGLDLLPMGNVYPKRISLAEGGMWDGEGAADAWAQDCDDSDHNGLPDWWEAYALANYLDGTGNLTWDTTVTYGGLKIPAWQAYLRDLAKGLVWDGETYYYDENYADTRDIDGDGMYDWWEDIYKINNNSKDDATADPDHDGLSNYQEYRISFIDEAKSVDPTLTRTFVGQQETDYFLQTTNKEGKVCYLGELYADHDFMEDDNEDEAGLDRTLYDANSDSDEDGWSAFSEMRYSTFKMGTAQRFLSHLVGDEEVTDFPIPVIHATLRYNGTAVSNATVIVEAYSGNSLTKAANATWKVVPGESTEHSILLGKWSERVIHGTLTPGHIIAGRDQFKLEYAFVQPNDVYAWTVDGTHYIGSYEEMYSASLQNGTNFVVAAQDLGWNELLDTLDDASGERKALQCSVDDNSQKGYFLLKDTRCGTIDLITGDFTLDLSDFGDTFVKDSQIALKQCFFRLSYNSKIPALHEGCKTVSLATADTGRLTEGTTAFTAFMDVDGDGAFTPGTDPIGFVKDVEVGWDQVPEITIEMTDESQAAGKRFAIPEDAATVRIIRTTINGEETLESAEVKRRIVYSRAAADIARKNVYEADLVTGGKFGLDWANLRSDIQGMKGVSLKDVTQVGYVVVTNTGSVKNISAADIFDSFTVTYSAEPVKPVCAEPTVKSYGIVETQRPTFKWTAADGFTAFRLQIGDKAGKDWFYDSGLKTLPARNGSSQYEWEAPVFIGTNVCSEATVLNNNSNYTWRVAMYNAKFSSTNEADTVWSEAGAFSTALAEKNDLSTKYGSAKVTVKYFGPATNELKDVIVDLYRTADFTGTPAARTRLFSIAGRANSLTNEQEVIFHGLKDGDYYAVAFIDRNGDGLRDKYETWGYSAQVGLANAAIWTPVAAASDATSSKIPSVELYMEDTDINQNDVLDIFDDESILKSAAAAVSGADSTDDDGDGLTADEETSDTYTDKASWDTDGDGMPDGWEARFADLDPLLSDADTTADGDVMAYVEVTRTLVTDEGGNAYLLNTTNKTVQVGDELDYAALVTTYDYVTIKGSGTNAVTKTLCGVGTNLVAKSTKFMVKKIESVKAVLVHAQVFDNYGYNQKTALVSDEAVNTKAFTALDKYMLIRYFAAIGITSADEEAMNKNGKWSDYTLKPSEKDNDFDGMADGWELYVMFGTNTVTAAPKYAKPAETPINPWRYADARDMKYDYDGDGLGLLGEYNQGKAPMNPWNAHTLNDEINDKEAFDFDIASGETQLADDDNDGLSNWAEYLAYKAGYGAYKVDDAYSLSRNGSKYVIDYFQKVTKDGSSKGRYAGEALDAAGTHLIADHDFIEDWWEDQYDVNFVNRYVYDFYGDKDGDGWSNWSEVRSSTDPTRVATLGVCGYSIAEHPTPLIKVVVNSDSDQILNSPIVFQAWKSSTLSGVPDAMWRLTTSSSESDNTRYLGQLKNQTYKGQLSPGSVIPGSVDFWFYPAQNSIKFWFGAYYRADSGDAITINCGEDDNYQYLAEESEDRQGAFVDKADPTDTSKGQIVIPEQNTVNGVETVVGEINYWTGEYSLDVTKVLSCIPEDAHIKVSYQCAVPANTMPATFYLEEAEASSSEAKGHILQGKNNFVIFADLDGDGAYTAGEPFGFARNVEVGWDKVPELNISLSTYGTTMPRMELSDGNVAADRDFETMTNTVVYSESANKQRVKIVRTAINGKDSNQLLFNRVMDFTQRTYLTEADVIRGNTFALDWAYLQNAALKVGIAPSEIKQVDYRVVLGDGSTKLGVSNNVALVFHNTFDATRVAPVVVSPGTNSYYKLLSAQPTFCWTGDDAYTAFKIEVAKGGTNDSDIVWTSGVKAMPALMPDGYCYAAPIYVGTFFDDVNGNPTKVLFEDNKEYFWRVAQYNAKFSTDEALGDNDRVWSAWSPFVTATDSERADSGYGKVQADVRYYGNAQNGLMHGTNTMVTVEAYATADFTGNPLARMRLGEGSLDTLAKTSASAETFLDPQADVTLDGLAPGEYYLIAYIDLNTNGTREVYEPWGYACQVGKVAASEDGKYRIWEPETIAVKSVKEAIASAVIFIEDTDVNQNMTPDSIEDMSGYIQAEADDNLEEEGGTGVVTDADGDGLTATEEDEAATDAQSWDSDGDGAPDGWEYKFAGTDPTDADDGALAASGDVMAYAEVKRDLIRIKSTETGVEAAYVVPSNVKTPLVGDNVNGQTFKKSYYYGTNQNFAASSVFGQGADVAVASTAEYQLAVVSNDVTAVNGEYLFAAEDAVGLGTNVYGYTAWTVKSVEGGVYHLGTETNFNVEATPVFGTNTVARYDGMVTVSLGENRVIEVLKDATVALVHAQVYDEFGFDSKTAVDVEDAVNTKPFTALDKYLVIRYLEALGLADEKAMNKAGVSYGLNKLDVSKSPWAKYTLKPLDSDNDKDGIADGWELYVMFGPAGADTGVSTHSPWSYDDRATDVDGDGLGQINEYDEGNYPTDPWDVDTGSRGIGDADVYAYGLKGENSYVRDDDNDQLSNFMEYMISRSAGFVDLDAKLMMTSGEKTGGDQLVPDYFLRHGSLYLGEMFTDHDFIEDALEDEQGATYSRYVYDANGDFDGDGWDNWSEIRAKIAAGYSNVVTVVTNESVVATNSEEVSLYNGTPTPKGTLRVVYNGKQAFAGKIVVKAYRNREGLPSHLNCQPDAFWTFDVAGKDATYELDTPDAGALAGGKSMFVVFLQSSEGDEESDEESEEEEEKTAPEWKVGAPYGIVTDVSVGYLTIADCAVELTDVNESAMRIDLVEAAGANEFTDQIELNDRGVNGAPQYENQSVTVDCTTNAFDTAKKVRLRVLRTALNNNIKLYVAKSYTTYYAGDTVLDTMIDSTCNTLLTEATIAATGSLDLDWDASESGNSLTSAGKSIGVGDIEFATYAILIGDSPTTFNPNVGITAGGTIEDLPILSTLFINRFESGAAGAQTKAVPTGLAASTSATQPTFTWTHENSIGKAYPAFRLRVWTNASAKSGEKTVYDSGNLRAPVRAADGKYSFTAPIYAGAQLTAGTTYYYSVSMLDAKFRTPTTTETRYAFTLTDKSSIAGLSDYTTIPVAVKYFGPGDTNATIWVEAFESPDFNGLPVAAGKVKHTDTLAATNKIELNAQITGVHRTGTYYIRAYLDTNANGVRDEWESWGYGNYVGTEREDVYTPRDYTLADFNTTGETPECVIYMEDADTNNNKLPDVWEWNKDSKLGGKSTSVTASASPYIVTINSTGAVSTNLFLLAEAGAGDLPYYSALTKFINGKGISSYSLALAMAGIDLDEVETTPTVTIESFSLTDGITLSVDARATVNGETLVPKAIVVTATVVLKLEKATAVNGTWQTAATATAKVSLGGTATVSSDDLVTDEGKSFKTVIQETVADNPSCFFRATVEVVE